ncbi:5' exonuclease Apollo [Octopus bimaculoides]|uniref:5' exonuclease Apollo n=1 Tax=Octopus bimaculoides TaxID=37653 RepID=A0A0L8GSY6_OCTBM|nr:5' exonuclease Apollo [Octopus bimaculoides]|eukprot:XP_014778254.1 PREDICTED: 5' exonuclease Apollo-like [Octopus bimaculoides]
MNGHIIKGTPIAVDFWQIRKCPDAKLFFLTHFHSDHTVGLTSSWNQPIYCSKVTGDLICKKFSIAQELIHPLELDTPVLIPIDSTNSEIVTVVAIDANHCPGSVMLLFQGYFGCMLYTGDFRYEPKVITDSYLSSLNYSVDTLYLDNTFCDPKCKFQTRTQATDWIMELISYYPGHDIIFGMSSLGKPNLLIEIAKHFQEFIAVPQKMFEYFELIETPDVFQIDTVEHECRLRVVPFYLVTEKYLDKLAKPTVAIFPTALYEGLDGSPYCNQNDIYVIPYSDHSSYPELVEFVKRINPKQIIPIVSANAKGPFKISLSHRADMSCFNQYLSTSPIKKYTMPTFLKNPILPIPGDNAKKIWSSAVKKKIQRSVLRRRIPKGVVFESPIKSSQNPKEKSDHLEPKINEENHKNITSVSENSPNSSKTDSNSKTVEALQMSSLNIVNRNSDCDIQDIVTGISIMKTPTKSNKQNKFIGRNSEIPDSSKENFAEKISLFENQSQQSSDNSEEQEASVPLFDLNVIENICRTNANNGKRSEKPFKISKTAANCREQLPMLEQLNEVSVNNNLDEREKETEDIDDEIIRDSENLVAESVNCGNSSSDSNMSTIYDLNEPGVVKENTGKKESVSSKKRKRPFSVGQHLKDYSRLSKRPKEVDNVRIEPRSFYSNLCALSSNGNCKMTKQYNNQRQRLVSSFIEQDKNPVENNPSTSKPSLDFTTKHVLSRCHGLQSSVIEKYQNIIEKFVLKQRKMNLL